MDRTDIKLLALLRKNARLSNKELASDVGLAESTCLERVRRLRQDGVLIGAHAEVNPHALGIHLQSMVMVRLRKHRREVTEVFRQKMLQYPEVLAIFLVSGQHDFLVHVGVPDSAYLRDFILDRITSEPEVVNVETTLIFDFWRNYKVGDFRSDELAV